MALVSLWMYTLQAILSVDVFILQELLLLQFSNHLQKLWSTALHSKDETHPSRLLIRFFFFWIMKSPSFHLLYAFQDFLVTVTLSHILGSTHTAVYIAANIWPTFILLSWLPGSFCLALKTASLHITGHFPNWQMTAPLSVSLPWINLLAGFSFAVNYLKSSYNNVGPVYDGVFCHCWG